MARCLDTLEDLQLGSIDLFFFGVALSREGSCSFLVVLVSVFKYQMRAKPISTRLHFPVSSGSWYLFFSVWQIVLFLNSNWNLRPILSNQCIEEGSVFESLNYFFFLVVHFLGSLSLLLMGSNSEFSFQEIFLGLGIYSPFFAFCILCWELLHLTVASDPFALCLDFLFAISFFVLICGSICAIAYIRVCSFPAKL